MLVTLGYVVRGLYKSALNLYKLVFLYEGIDGKIARIVR